MIKVSVSWPNSLVKTAKSTRLNVWSFLQGSLLKGGKGTLFLNLVILAETVVTDRHMCSDDMKTAWHMSIY